MARRVEFTGTTGYRLDAPKSHRLLYYLVHGHSPLIQTDYFIRTKRFILSGGLIPFTHWITPANVSRRYTTQMYLYFLPFDQESSPDKHVHNALLSDGDGIEVTEATFLPASVWLQRAHKGEVVLFPPQFLLLQLIAQHLDSTTAKESPETVNTIENLEKRRLELISFVHSGSPPWTHKCISPKLLKLSSDGRAVLSLDHPGLELDGSDKRGDMDRVVLVRFKKGTTQDVEVWWRKDAFLEGREEKSRI